MNKFSAARAFLWPWTNVFAVERFCSAETSFSVGRRGEEFDLETLEKEKKKKDASWHLFAVWFVSKFINVNVYALISKEFYRRKTSHWSGAIVYRVRVDETTFTSAMRFARVILSIMLPSIKVSNIFCTIPSILNLHKFRLIFSSTMQTFLAVLLFEQERSNHHRSEIKT